MRYSDVRNRTDAPLEVETEDTESEGQVVSSNRRSPTHSGSPKETQFGDPLLDGNSEAGGEDDFHDSEDDEKVAAASAAVIAVEMGADGGVTTPITQNEEWKRLLPFQAGCVWTELDWSCAYDAVFMVFFAIYLQSSPGWRGDWRQQAPEWTIPLADRFDLLLGALKSEEHSREGLSAMFSHLRDQFRDQLSSFNPGRFTRNGMVTTSVCSILELLFGSALGPSIVQHLSCTNCGAASRASHGFPLLGLLHYQDYRRRTDGKFISSETLLTRFIEALDTTPDSSLCSSCHGAKKVQSLTMGNSPWIWFETKRVIPMSPSPTILIELPSQRSTYDLHSVIYLGGKHFTARMRDPFNHWWNYDGMRILGAPQRDSIQHPTGLLRNGRRDAAFFIYRRRDH